MKRASPKWQEVPGKVSMRPVEVLEHLGMPQRHALQDTQNGGLSVNELQGLRVSQELTGVGDEMQNVQYFERVPRERRLGERKC